MYRASTAREGSNHGIWQFPISLPFSPSQRRRSPMRKKSTFAASPYPEKEYPHMCMKRSRTVEKSAKHNYNTFYGSSAPTPAYECRNQTLEVQQLNIEACHVAFDMWWSTTMVKTFCSQCGTSSEEKSSVADRKPIREWLTTHESPSATGMCTRMRAAKPLSRLVEIPLREKQLENYVC